MDTFAIIFEEKNGINRINEPVTLGIPFPKGALFNDTMLALRDESTRFLPLQTHVMERWSDQSCKWVLLDFQATVLAHRKVCYTLEWGLGASSLVAAHIVTVTELAETIRVETNIATFLLDRVNLRPFKQVVVDGIELLESHPSRLILTDARGQTWEPRIEKVSVEASGPIRATLFFEGSFRHPRKGGSIAVFFSRIHFFAGRSVVKIEFTIRNPRPAKHSGGLWDLGDPGSIYFEDLSMHAALRGGKGDAFLWTEKATTGLKTAGGPCLEIYQDSSGGENWQSPNHVNRFGKVMNTFRGYRVRAYGISLKGGRAQPTLILSGPEGAIAAAIQSFWQNFPKALEANRSGLTVRLFPVQYTDVFELQGGEQKTHTVYLHFSSQSGRENPIAWVHEPLVPRPEPELYAGSQVFPYMVPEARDPNREYLDLVHRGIEGENNFFQRREIIDEYGWRHFGDLYADHEAAYYSGLKPVISHYNNQYDAIYSFALHYARSGDSRWFELMQDLARHVIDIDIYHTLGDKAAYSGGLFWHTDHYTDAATSTHRTFSRRTMQERGLKDYGGGPCSEHLYTTGLMTYYFLTGDVQGRDAVISLADWVIRMDDGNLTPLRFLSRGATGLASQTASRDYHGPGRGAANSVNALLDAYRLSRNQNYLAKAEELIRRCVHPLDSIDPLALSDAERRWSYLVFLQMLGKYLDCKVEWDQLDNMFHYARESLLHYARWMVEHEVPYSQVMDKVEYPTETWVAQDLRKSNVLEWAALYSSGEEREQFFKRANFFYDNCFDDLKGYATKACMRPLVLLLHYGWMHSYFQLRDILPQGRWHRHRPPEKFARAEVFRSQRQLAEARLRLLSGISGAVMISLLAVLMLLVK
jgi:YetA-like protein